MRRSVKALVVVVGMMATLPALGKIEVSSSGSQTVYDIKIEGVELKPVNIGGKDFVSARLKGVERFDGVRYDIGKPEVPVVRLIVDGDVTVESLGGMAQASIDASKPIKPSQSSWSKSSKFAPPVSYDDVAYNFNGFKSEPLFEIKKVGSTRGVARHMLTLNVMRYNAVTGQYQIQNHVKVTVSRKSVMNDSVQPTMAFVVGAKFNESPSLASLIRMKEQQGFRTRKIVIGQNAVVTDVDIRNTLKGILSENVNLRFATIVGDAEDVPGHVSTHISGVTDHYYRSIDTSDYESDINGPDISVGRLSVNTEAQLAAVVSKISRYTDGRFSKDQWMQHPAFVTTHDRYQVAEGTHNDVIAKHFAPRGYDRVFPDSNEKGGDKLFPITLNATPEQIVDHMKAGRFIINYSGHGSHTGWEDVSAADVNSLNDPNALPWVISNACITGDFREEPVFAETWLRNPNGAIVFWGSMDSSYWDEDDVLEKGMYDAVFELGKRSFDLIHQHALGEVWRRYGGENKSAYYWETYVTFGDPSLEVRLAKSSDPEVEGPDALIIGANEATWKIKANNSPVSSARISLYRASDGKSVSGLTDDQGEITLGLSAFGSVAEPVTMIAVGGDLKKMTRDLALIAPNQPYLGFSNWTVNGRAGGGVHVGELINLSAVVENFGLISTSGGRVVIGGISGPAVVARAEASVPALASREREAISSGLAFTVNPEARRGESIRVQLTWETKEGQTGQVQLSWPVLRGDLEVSVIDYGDSSVEGIGTEGQLFVTLRNIGNELMRGTELRAQAGKCTSRVDGSLSISELAPGAATRVAIPLQVVTDGQCESGSIGDISLQGYYESASRQLSVAAGVSYLVGVLETEIERYEGLALPIPDQGDLLTKTIQMNGSGTIKDVSVYIKINHTFVGDLDVKLVSPSGKEILLHNRSGGSADVIEQRYGRGGLVNKDLESLIGSEVRGEWKITVQDTISSDVGTLDAVELTIRHW